MVGGNNKVVVATLRADGKVYPEGFIGQLANTLMNYKIRTEADMANKTNTMNVVTTVVDLGKQLLQYARDSDLKGVRNMMSRGAPFTSDWLGMSALHFAAMNNQYEICEALLKGGINKDSKTKVDRTPLHLASYYGNDRIVELLLAKKCAINPMDMLRMTPLHWAVEKRHKKIVRLLLEHHGDVTIVSKFGRTPIALAVITEQADLLEELEAAKKMQLTRLIYDEQEKETSDAVNSIIGGLKSELVEERIMDVNSAGGGEAENIAYADNEEEIGDLSDIKESGMLDHSAINLLKSHGISMMQDDDEDTSKDLLANVLRNGRQLVLTEGGKLLLNESKRKSDQVNTSSNNNGSGLSNGSQTILPRRNEITPINKIRTSVISKAKNNNNPATGLGKNKNIRIISLNDFKKLYGSTDLKAIHKLPSSLANSSRVVRKLTNDGDTIKSAERKVVIGATGGQVQNRQLKTPLTEVTKDCSNSNIIDKENPTSDIIEIEPIDCKADVNECVEQRVTAGGHTSNNNSGTQSVRVISATRLVDQSASQSLPVRPYNVTRPTVSGGATSKANSETMSWTSASSSKLTPSVIPILSLPEICRQLFELRKQNEELRRKFDFAQKEKEELCQRLDRLEELLLVERTDDDDYTES